MAFQTVRLNSTLTSIRKTIQIATASSNTPRNNSVISKSKRLLWCGGSSSSTNHFRSLSTTRTINDLQQRHTIPTNSARRLLPVSPSYYLPHKNRNLATAAAAASSSSSTESNTNKSSDDRKSSSNDNKTKTAGDYFLDHLGNIFLSAIAIIILALLRSSRGTSNKTKLRTELEEQSALDPAEMDDLRVANSELDQEVYELIVTNILEELRRQGGITTGAGGGAGGGAASLFDTGGGEGVMSRSDDSDGTPSSVLPAMTYPEFISRVMIIMNKMKGEEFTIQMGHLIDRVVLTDLDKRNTNDRNEADNNNNKEENDAKRQPHEGTVVDGAANDGGRGNAPLELSFLLTVLSLALHTPTVRDRIEVLFDVMHHEHTYNDGSGNTLEEEGDTTRMNLSDTTLLDNDTSDNTNNNNNNNDASNTNTNTKKTTEKKVVKTRHIRDMIGYLQRTSQLVADTQIVETATKYPAQIYKVGTPDELVALGMAMKKDELSDEALLDGRWSCDDFHHLLRSRSVCAWGECYTKKKGLI